MGNALRHVRGESQKNIVRFIEGLSGKYSRWDIWQDFIIMSAIAIANTMGGPQVKAREEMYRSRAEKYSAKELEVFADMLFEVVAELERDQEQDFLGELFMALGLGNEWKGQFFTPYDICRAMWPRYGGADRKAGLGIRERSRLRRWCAADRVCQRVPETAHQLSDFGVVRGTGHRLSCRVYVLHPT